MLTVQIPLTISCHSSLSASPLDDIQCSHTTDGFNFLLVGNYSCIYARFGSVLVV